MTLWKGVVMLFKKGCAMQLLGFLLLMLITTQAFASAMLVTANDFKQVNQAVQKMVLKKGAHDVLIVLDNDNTLTTMPQTLGSVGWWQWQERLLREYHQHPKHPPKDLVAHSFQGLLQVQLLLFDLSAMKFTDPMIPHYLQKWHQQGVTMMVMTERNPAMAQATYSQLERLGIAKFFSQNAIKTQNGTTSYPTRYVTCSHQYPQVDRPIAYHHGIVFEAGQNKGLVLQCFLKQVPEGVKRYTDIVFVDDMGRNDREAYEAYRDDPAAQLIAIHYTRVNALRKKILVDKKLQAQAAKGWRQIRSALKGSLARPNLPHS